MDLGNDTILFDKELFASKIVEAVVRCTKLDSPLHCSQSVTYMGTFYSKDAYVVLAIRDSEMVFGKVLLCLMDSQGIGGLVVSMCRFSKVEDLGVHVIQETDDNRDCICVLVTELWDYCPLPGYYINGSTYVAFKHAVFDPVSDN